MVCVEYIDEAFEGQPLLPVGEPALRARVRRWCIFANDNVIPHFYRLLMKTTDRERENEKKIINRGVKDFRRCDGSH